MHAQRVKVKSLPRTQSNRMSVNSAHFTKGCQSPMKDDESGIYSNYELTYVLSRHVIGNIGEITTTNDDKLLGVIKAISPSGDMGLGYPYKLYTEKNGHINGSSHTVPLSNWKLIRIPNVKIADCLLVENKIESDGANEPDISGVTEEKELIPFFASSDAPKDCFLDEGGFSVEEMYKTNKELFSVSTTYNPDLPEYKTPVDKSAPNYPETEARCAQLAREIEASEYYRESLDDICDDEESPYGSFTRPSKDTSLSRHSIRESRNPPERTVNSDVTAQVTKQIARISVRSGERDLDSLSQKPHVHSATFTFDGVPVNDSAKESSAPSVHVSPAESASVDAVFSTNCSTQPSTESNDPPSSTIVSSESKIKKSTLDPNAPLFQPLSMLSTSISSSVQISTYAQPTVHNLAFTPHVIHPNANANPSGNMPVQSLTAFVAAPQIQLYIPSSMPYGSHAGDVSHIMPAALASSITSNVAQQVRGGSLPPSLHQPFNGTMNSNPGVLLQLGQHGASATQIISQPSMVQAAGASGRFTSSSLVRQSSNEVTTASQNSYGQPSNVAIPAMQSPFYQLPQAGSGFPFWLTGTPQMGFNLVPGTGNSSTLMVSNIQLQQAAGQQIYPAHAMLHVQPQLSIPTMPLEPASTAQQGQHHPMFPAHPGQFSEHPVQIPQYAQGMMFTQPTGGFYPAAPVLTGPGVINPAMRAGLLPVLNQPTTQHPAATGSTHQSGTFDSLSINPALPTSSFPQPSCQPAHMQNYGAVHPLLQSQQLTGNASISSQTVQPEAYHNFVALLARNLSSQSR